MIEIFKTNVDSENEAQRLISLLKLHLTTEEINFDLEDCDKILRIEDTTGLIPVSEVEDLVSDEGYLCEILRE